MRKMHRYWVVLLALVEACIWNPAKSAVDCNAILSNGLRNIEKSSSQYQVNALKYQLNCGKDYDKMSESDVANTHANVFGYFSGAGDFSRGQQTERIKEWCNVNKASYVSGGAASEETQTIYAGSVSAWAACNRLAAKSLEINPVVSPDARTVDIGVSYNGPGTGVTLNGLLSEGFACTTTVPATLKAITFPYQIGKESIQINCKRAASSPRILKGETYDFTDRGTISVQTVGDPFQLYFAPEWNPPAPLQALEAFKADLAQRFQHTITVYGNEVKCGMMKKLAEAAKKGEDPWSSTQLNSDATCPANSVILNGSCDYTCYGSLDHTSSFQTGNTWRCKARSDDTDRTYRAVAQCLSLK